MGLYETRVERLKKWMNGERAGPVSIELIPTERCNLDCLSCWRQGWDKEKLEERYSEEMDDERLMKLVDEAAELEVKEFAFVGGGEPLVREVTRELIKKIKKKGMECDLVTNGALFNYDMIEEFVDIGVNRIKFSIDGVNAETHDYLRGVEGTFDKVVENIKQFSKKKEEMGKDKPDLLFNTVVSRKNYIQLPDIVKMADDIGINGIMLLPLTVFEGGSMELKLTDEDNKLFGPILSESIKISNEFGMSSNFENFLDQKYMIKTESMDEVMMEEAGIDEKPKDNPTDNFVSLPCFIPWHHVTIISNGNIAPCFSPWVWGTDVSIKDHSLKELWYGDYFDKFREIMLTRKLPGNCKRCCVWEVFNNRDLREGIRRFVRNDNIR